jgi:hypothetical protein
MVVNNSEIPDIVKYGSGIWATMHLVVNDIHLPQNTKIQFIKFCQKVIPCQKCRHDCLEYISKHPLNKDTDMSRWVYNFHKHVNSKTNVSTSSYKSTLEYYTDYVVTPKSGPGIWYMIHLISLTQYFTFGQQCSILRTIIDNIRCKGKHCRLNYEFLNNYQPENYKNNLYRWSYAFHFKINEMIGKKSIDYNESKNYYKSYLDENREESCQNCKLPPL